jgi:hypothetical protein
MNHLIRLIVSQQRGAEHYSKETKESTDPSAMNHIKCPICMRVVEHVKEFVPFKPNIDPFLRMQLITIVFRCESDSNNNSALSRLFGTPYIVRIPSCLPESQFNEFIARMNLFPHCDYKVAIVDIKVSHCWHISYYPTQCRQCDVFYAN